MRCFKNAAQNMSRRTLALTLSCAVFVVMLLSVVSGAFLFSDATNLTTAQALNTYEPVEYINLMPVKPTVGEESYYDIDNNTVVDNADSRTDFVDGAADYLTVTPNGDDSVTFRVSQTKAAATNDTTYVETVTQVGQRINLKKNPYLMFGFESSSARANATLYFSVTKNGTTYYFNINGAGNTGSGTPSTTDYADNSYFTFKQIQENRYQNHTDGTSNDFGFSYQLDYTIDLYSYLYSFFVAKGITDYWPAWDSDNNYLTIEKIRHTVVGESTATPLYEGASVKWLRCGLGREALTQNDTLTPREESVVDKSVNNGDGATEDDFNSEFARLARLDDGVMVFRNASTDKSVTFTWDVQRYFNIAEFGALVFDAQYAGYPETENAITMNLMVAGNPRIDNNAYTGDEVTVELDAMIRAASDKMTASVPDRYSDVKIDIAAAIEAARIEGGKGDSYYPDDQLLRIREIQLTLPPNAKLSVKTLSVAVKNEYSAATEENTVYPWAASEKPNNLPPVGTPATTADLNAATGAYSAAYDWIATEIPVTQSKVDLLALTDQHAMYENGIFTDSQSDDLTGFWRTLDSGSYFTSETDAVVYRSFKRREHGIYDDGGVEGTGDNENNFNLHVSISTTPYLYFSYEVTGGDDAAAGLYFRFADDTPGSAANGSGEIKPYYQFYLGQSGLALKPCDEIMNASTADVDIQAARRALCSSATARTGIIDLRSIGFGVDDKNDETNDDLAKLNEVRFYVTGVNTEVHFNYLFLGSESLSEAATNTIAKNSGDAFPWAVSHDAFKDATIGIDSDFTFANRVNVLEDLRDRVMYHLEAEWKLTPDGGSNVSDADIDDYLNGAEYEHTYVKNEDGTNSNTIASTTRKSVPEYKVYEEDDDGAVTVNVAADKSFQSVGSGFDHVMSIDIDTSKLSSLRYLNYSVEADSGMRWAILFEEHTGSPTHKAGIAVRTWNDAFVYGVQTSTPSFSTDDTYAKSYFRDMDATDVFKEYWYNDDGTARDDAWSVFTVPGSETGCFDISQIVDNQDKLNMSWDNIVSISLIAYKDPYLKSDNGSEDVAGSVTFNYLYFTSEPLTGNSFGAAPDDNRDGIIDDDLTYSWPCVDETVSLYLGTEGQAFDDTTNPENHRDQDWGATDFFIDSSHTACELTDNIFDYYNFYYSFTFTEKRTNSEGESYDTHIAAYPPMAIAFFSKDGGDYVYRLAHYGADVQYGASTILYSGTKSMDDFAGNYWMQMPTSGAIAMSQFEGKISEISYVRVFYDFSKYYIHVEYCKLAVNDAAWQAVDRSPTHTKLITALTQDQKTANFSAYPYTVQNAIVNVIESPNAVHTESQKAYDRNLEIDLNRTPYLYYSVSYAEGSTGTFAFETVNEIAKTNGFFRDGSVAAIGSNILLGAGVSPTASQYMPTSETGCINVAQWLREIDSYPSDGILNTTKLWIFVSSGGSAKYNYMYFGPKADKTIDLIPSKAGGDLESGVSTHSWSYDNAYVDGEVTDDGDDDDDYDDYITASLANKETKPALRIRYDGDQNGDTYNDLHYDVDYDSGFVPDSDSEEPPENWGYHSVCYGQIQEKYTGNYTYVSTGSNQMSGLTINLNETPYLHFSITQPDDSYTTFVLQTANCTSDGTRHQSSDSYKPWLSCYNTRSTAGQLMNVASYSQYIARYKDAEILYDNGCYVKGDVAGVIDLRTWFTKTNGYGDIVTLERIRFYCTKEIGKATNATVNHFYLSSSCGAAYSVKFDKNDGSGSTTTVQVLKNADDQFVSDKIAADRGYKTRDGYTFVGWYEDEKWEKYFDITTEPITENMTLYAGWIDNTDAEGNGDEANFLEDANDVSNVTVDDEAVHIDNTTGSEPLTVDIPVNKAYSITEMPSLYIGFDTNKTSDGVKIELNLKSRGSNSFDVLGDAFGGQFLTENGLLTAGPYDQEMSMYTRLATDNLLPVDENKKGYVYANSVTVTVPAGVAIHLRYFMAAKSLSAPLEATTVVAPAFELGFDLLEPGDDSGFVEQVRAASYELLGTDKNVQIYDKTETLRQTKISGVDVGYATLGSLYNLGNPLGNVEMVSENPQYLYFSVTQSDNSSTTFNIWSSVTFTYTDEAGIVQTKTAWPPKWSTFYDHSLAGQENILPLGSANNMDSSGSIPSEAYAAGSFSGYINLYEWYKDAMKDTAEYGGYEDLVVTNVQITGLRLYSSHSGTDATFNYLAVGGAPENDDTFAKVSYTADDGSSKTVQFSDNHCGQSVQLSLDQLTDSLYASDPSVVFKGWSFTNPEGDVDPTPVWWNVYPQNFKEATDTNLNGAWSKTKRDGFVQNRADVTYQLTNETAVIYPVFGSAYQPTLSLDFSGNGKVVITQNGVSSEESVTKAGDHTFGYGDSVVLTAVGANFAGWYENGKLVSDARDYHLVMYDDAAITADFTLAPPAMEPYQWQTGKSIVWLQSSSDLTAGTDFKLESVNDNSTVLASAITNSNIDDLDGTSQIICYWEIENGQMVRAVADEGYHFEQLLSDGTTAVLSDSNTYTFIASTDIKLLCVANEVADEGTDEAAEGAAEEDAESSSSVIVNEYAVNFDRSQYQSALITAQAILDDNEEIVSCGAVIAMRPTAVVNPSYHSAESTTASAAAWNSTTGQFTVNVPRSEPYRAYYLRAYAIVFDRTTQKYEIRYSDFITKSF